MSEIRLRKASTPAGEGLLFSERISGSGQDIVDILVDGNIRTYLADHIRTNGKRAVLPRGCRKVYREYMKSQSPEIAEPPETPHTPPDGYDEPFPYVDD